jgi:hypothetical protein
MSKKTLANFDVIYFRRQACEIESCHFRFEVGIFVQVTNLPSRCDVFRGSALRALRYSARWPHATPSVASLPVRAGGSQSPTGAARRTRCNPTLTSRA